MTRIFSRIFDKVCPDDQSERVEVLANIAAFKLASASYSGRQSLGANPAVRFYGGAF